MDKMYIPNTQKWIQYYQNLDKDGHNPYLNYIHRGGTQIGGGSLSGSPRQFITPVGHPHKTDKDEKITVNLVSPVQQSIDQAKDEIKRNNQGIKRKRTKKTVSPSRKRQRKKTQKKKGNIIIKKKLKQKRRQKAVKRLKKSSQKKLSRQTKKNKSGKKKLKSTFNDIFSK